MPIHKRLSRGVFWNGVIGLSGGELLATSTTDENGAYSFTNVVASQPRVLGVLLSLPSIMPPTVPNPKGHINDPAGGGAPPIPILAKLYADANDDGVINPATDLLLAATTTDSAGNYAFSNQTAASGGTTVGILFYMPTCWTCVVPNPGGFWETLAQSMSGRPEQQGC